MDLDWDAVAERFDAADVDDENLPVPSYAITPTHTIGLIAQDQRGRRHLSAAYWSLIPRWEHGMTLPYPTYNARIESAHVKPAYAASTASMRAIIPASGYYEWQGRRPFYFHADDDAPLFFGGLYSWWHARNSDPWRLTATIITCPAAAPFAHIHDRMPLLIAPALTNLWLDPHADGAQLLKTAERAGSTLSSALAFHEVAPLQGDGPQCIEPVEPPNATSLF